MSPRNLLQALRLAIALFAVFSCGCAVDGGVREDGPSSAPPSVSAARLGLPAPLRPFHDELEPYGDWILIEPQGWVFRPRVNSVAWRPYSDGHWEPSYSYGWIWESNDPFGWITDHYGFWFHDSFQGWVWQPYGAWAPSWVAWVGVGDYVGWAPLPPSGVADYDEVPGGLFTYVNSRTLASPIGSRASFVTDIPDEASGVQPIDRIASLHGVYWNAGPDPEAILGLGAVDRLRADERDGRAAVPAPPRSLVDAIDVDLGLLESRTVRAWNEARRELRAVRARRAGSGAQAPPAREDPTPPPATPAPPRIKPTPLTDTTRADSAGVLERFKRSSKLPRVPRRPN